MNFEDIRHHRKIEKWYCVECGIYYETGKPKKEKCDCKN